MSNAKKGNTKTTPKKDDAPKEINVSEEIKKIESEIIEESIKITKNEVSSCYTLVIKTKRLLELRLMESK